MPKQKVFIYCRYSSDMQNPKSCDDQVREVKLGLERREIDTSQAEVLHDKAKSGRTQSRSGFQALLKRLEAGQPLLIAVDDQSRLSRQDSVMSTLTDIVFNGGRFISVGEGIDTAEEGWELRARMMGIHHATSSEETGRRVRRGIRGRVEAGHSPGDIIYGYESFYENPEAALSFTGAGPKPPKSVRINESEAFWVREIFALFAAGDRPKQIAEKLTLRKAPKCSRSRGSNWSPQQIRSILQNEKYIGRWSWGKTHRRRSSSGRLKQVPAPPEDLIVKDYPNRRIIAQDLWIVVQQRLADLHAMFGYREGQQKRGPKTHFTQAYDTNVLLKLLRCGHCGSKMLANANQDGDYRRCKKSGNGPDYCNVRNRVRSDAVKRALYRFTADVLSRSPEWIAATLEQMQLELANSQDKSVSELKATQKRIQDTRQRQENLLRLAEEASIDSSVLSHRLRKLEEQLTSDLQLSRELEALRTDQVPELDTAWFTEHLTSLAEIIGSCGETADRLLPKIMSSVRVYAIRPAGKERGYHELRFRFIPWGVLTTMLPKKAQSQLLRVYACNPESASNSESPEFRVPVGGPTELDLLTPKIVQLRNEGVIWRHIEERLGISISRAYKAWKRYTDYEEESSNSRKEA